jgi:predicted nucleic acid-binding Zn ribbon protein
MNWKPWTPVDDAEDEPRPVGASLSSIARSLGLTNTHTVVTVFGEWEQLVGPVLAAHTRPERLTDGELLIVVDEPAWATEVRILAPQLLERLAKALGENGDLVERVTVRVDRFRPTKPGAKPST